MLKKNLTREISVLCIVDYIFFVYYVYEYMVVTYFMISLNISSPSYFPGILYVSFHDAIKPSPRMEC